MRDVTGETKIREVMRLLGRAARTDVRVYFTGGTTAVLLGWRDSTVDIDLGFSPETDEIFRAIPEIKEVLRVNIELALPSHFIPPLPGWEDRCVSIGREGKASFFHYDPYSQALSKIERGHDKDMADVAAMMEKGLIERGKLLTLFEEIKTELYKYPSIDQEAFEKGVRDLEQGKENPENVP